MFDPATLRNAPVQVTVGSARGGQGGQPTSSGVSCGDGIQRAAHDVVDHRHRRGHPRREPARVHHACAKVPTAHKRSLCPDKSDKTSWKRPRSSRNWRRACHRLANHVTFVVSACGLTAADLSSPDVIGVGQRVDQNIVEIIDAQQLRTLYRRSQSRALPCA